MARIVPSYLVPGSRPAVPPGVRSPILPSPRFPASKLWPTLLYDQITVPNGGELQFRSANFQNNLGRPIDLREMRAVVINSDLSFTGSGGNIELQITIEGIPLTRGYVPIWNLTRSDGRDTGGGDDARAWVFSHPVPLLPGQQIDVQVRNLGMTTGDLTVGVTFAGEAVPTPAPKRFPYAASWTSKSFEFAENAIDSSPPSALVNDTKRDLHVDRIIGRFASMDNSGPGIGEGPYVDYQDTSIQAVQAANIRIGLSQGRPILKPFTRWRAVFGFNSAVETDFDLKPNDYLIVDIQHISGARTPEDIPFLFFNGWGTVSIVGWREI